jgi:hypothetical protein
MSVVPTAPQASTLVPTGTNSAHQVSFNITDTTTSEQRFELWRKIAGQPDSAYIKVNEAGINAPFINDASAQPNTTYDYILLGYNFVSGYTPMAAAIANKVTQTTAAPSAPAQGLNVQYFNDDFGASARTARCPRTATTSSASAATPSTAPTSSSRASTRSRTTATPTTTRRSSPAARRARSFATKATPPCGPAS